MITSFTWDDDARITIDYERGRFELMIRRGDSVMVIRTNEAGLLQLRDAICESVDEHISVGK